MRLKFRGFIAECALNTFAKLELSTAECAFQIGEAFLSEVLKLWDKGLQLFDALSEVLDRKGFRSRPLRFCACHRVWEKCSPRLLD